MFKPVRVLDVELSDPPVALDGLNGYAAVRVLVRLYGVPLGYVELPVTGAYIEAADLRGAMLEQLAWPIIRQHLLGLLERGPTGSPTLSDLYDAPVPRPFAGPWPSVTVAVCTRNRPADLALCLAALCRLDYPALDLLVVDNAPNDDATERLVYTHYPQVRYVREERPGLNWARNRAILECRGEILAYTDDDVMVDRDWVRGLARIFAENPGVMAVTGLVVPFELETAPQLAFENYGGFGRGFRQRWFSANLAGGERAATNYANTGQCGTGANMAFRRTIFDQIGFFDPALDVGTVSNGGGDLEIFFRVIKAGHPLVYEPRALVRHRHRREYERFYIQIANNGVGFYAYLVRCLLAYPDERLALLRLGIWWFCYWDILRLLQSFVRPVNCSRALILAELKGALVGLGRYQQARRHARALARPGDPPCHIHAPGQHRRPTMRPHGIAMRSIELTEVLQPLNDVLDYPVVRIYIQHQGRPLGSFDIANRYQPITLERLREAMVDNLSVGLLTGKPRRDSDILSVVELMCARYLGTHQGEQGLPATTITPAPGRDLVGLPGDVPVSVVVATCDNPGELRDCLHSLSFQKTQRPLELIVVDNNPASGVTAPVVALFPMVRLVSEQRRGLAYARNAGVATSSGAIVVMVEDNVTVAPDWLERLIAPFARADVMAVTGNVLPNQLETSAQRLFERHNESGRGFECREFDAVWFRSFSRQAVPIWEIGSTTNAAFRATIFSHPAIGLFEETLGAGTPAGCGEDTYLLYRLLSAGYSVVYEPAALVYQQHHHDMSALRHQIHQYNKGKVAYQLTTLFNDGDRRALPHLLVHTPYAFAQKLLSQARAIIRGRNDYPISLILAEIAGYLAGPRALVRSRRRVAHLGRSAPYVPAGQRAGATGPAVLELKITPTATIADQ